MEDINPDLAEAFNHYARKNGRLIFGRANPVFEDKIQVSINDSAEKNSDIEDINFQEENVVITSTEHSLFEFQHIQKIPKN